MDGEETNVSITKRRAVIECKRKIRYVCGPFSPTLHSGVSVVLHFSHRKPLGRGGRPRDLYT